MSQPTRPGAIGIDVVDPRERRWKGQSEHTRFVTRVFAPEESARIAAAEDPDLALWIHWAAKEAVFKAESCALGSAPVFDHSTFVFRPEAMIPDRLPTSDSELPDPGWRPMLRGVVDREGRQHPVLLSLTGAVAAVAGPHGMPGDALESALSGVRIGRTAEVAARLGMPLDLEQIRSDDRWSPEADRAHSPESAVVRMALRRDLRQAMAARSDDRAGSTVVVTPEGPPGRTPPWAGTAETPHEGVDISISHHGGLIAWAWRFSDPADAS